MRERETQTHKTQSGIEYKVKTWLTRREVEKIDAKYMQSIKPKFDGKGEMKDAEMNMEAIALSTHEAIKQALMSLGGEEDKNKILEIWLDLPNGESQEIEKKIDELTGILPKTKEIDSKENTNATS